MRFTDKGIAALKPKADRYEVWEDGRTGFGVRVSHKGRKTWMFMYRFGGKARRMSLGNYPAVSLSSARVKLANAKKALDHGDDPGASALAERAADRAASTVKELVDEYLERSAKGIRSYNEVKRVLEKDVIAAWGRRKANSIKRRDVILLLDEIVDRGAPVMANRTLAWVRRMFNFAIAREVVEINPTAGVEAPGTETKRERVLTDAELRDLWNGLPKADLTDALRLASKLALLTAQRPGEAAGMTKAELSLAERLWTIPPERSKNKRAHVVPLSAQAVALIETALSDCAKGEVVFPHSAAGKPITSRDISMAFVLNAAALGIPTPPTPDTRKKPSEEALRHAKRERRRVAYSPHDLRRTAATRMTEMGFTRFVVDRVLNHTEHGVGGVYDRYEYLREKRAALDAWGQRLDEILAGKKAAAGNVVPLRTA